MSLLALDDKAAKQFIGRVDGPKLVQPKKMPSETSMVVPGEPQLYLELGGGLRDGWMT